MLGLILHATVSQAQPQNDALIKSYLEVKDALVADDSKKAASLATTWLTTLNAVVAFKEKETLIRQITKISGKTDLESQRAALADLSTALWPILKHDHKLRQDLFYFYCPMKKTYWISDEAQVKNPYYGSAMLTCGSISEQNHH